MRIIQLTQAEAGDPAVMAQVRALLAADPAVAVTLADRSIGIDAPDVGVEVPVPPLSAATVAVAAGSTPSPTLAPAAAVDPSAVFGVPVIPQPPAAPPAPPAAGAVPLPTAPAVTPVSGVPPVPPVTSVPVPPPANEAPVPPGFVAPSTPAAGVDLDTDGLPWDARIHSGSRKKNADGRWTAKRGVNNAEYVKAIQAELRQVMTAGPTAAPVVAPPPVPSTPAALPAPPTGVPPASPSSADPFVQLMNDVSARMVSGTLTHQQITAVMPQVQLQSVDQLQHRHDLIPFVRQQLGLPQ